MGGGRRTTGPSSVQRLARWCSASTTPIPARRSAISIEPIALPRLSARRGAGVLREEGGNDEQGHGAATGPGAGPRGRAAPQRREARGRGSQGQPGATGDIEDPPDSPQLRAVSGSEVSSGRAGSRAMGDRLRPELGTCRQWLPQRRPAGGALLMG